MTEFARSISQLLATVSPFAVKTYIDNGISDRFLNPLAQLISLSSFPTRTVVGR